MARAAKWLVLGLDQQPLDSGSNVRTTRSAATVAARASSVSINANGTRLLRSFDERTRPVNLLTIFGAARQGKSFLMNCLLDSDDAFTVSSLVAPCTTGCDIAPSAVPVEEFRPRGTSGNNRLTPRPTSPVVALVDMEGQGDKGDSYDVKLVTPLLVLSKVVMFNWLGKPNKDTMLNRLAVLELAAKRLARSARAGAFGHLIVVFRDCRSDLAPAMQQLVFGLEDAASATTDEQERQIAHLNGIRKQLAASFASIDVVCLPSCHPEASVRNVSVTEVSHDFKEAVQILREKLSTRLSAPHTFGGMPVQSAMVLCDAAEEMVKAVNDEKNDISPPSMLESIYSSLANRAHDEAYAAFEAVIASLTTNSSSGRSSNVTINAHASPEYTTFAAPYGVGGNNNSRKSSRTNITTATNTNTTTLKTLTVAATENVLGSAVAAGRLTFKEHTLSYVQAAPSASCGAVLESASRKLEQRLTAGSNAFREQQKSARSALNERMADQVREALERLDEETKRILKPRLPMKESQLLDSWDACEVAVWVDLDGKQRKLASAVLLVDLPAACKDQTQLHNLAAKLRGGIVTANKDALVRLRKEQRLAQEKEALKADAIAEQERARRAEATARHERRMREEEGRKREEEARAYQKKRAEDERAHATKLADARRKQKEAEARALVRRQQQTYSFDDLLNFFASGGGGGSSCGGSSRCYGSSYGGGGNDYCGMPSYNGGGGGGGGGIGRKICANRWN